jgi:hypothetical protein
VVAAIQRRYGDAKQYQDWETFKKTYLDKWRATSDDAIAAFGLWASGKYSKGVNQALNVEALNRAPDIEALPYLEVPQPGTQLDPTLPKAKTLKEIVELQTELKNTQDIVRREEINDQLDKLPSLTRASEDIGDAAAKQVAEKLFGANPNTLVSRRGSGVPDVMFDKPNSDVLVVIEAKGGGSPLGTRKEADGDLMVQQGTKEYLYSLAKAMQRSKNPAIQADGRTLETKLLQGKVEYYLVRQEYNPVTGTLAAPMLARFDITQGGKKVR